MFTLRTVYSSYTHTVCGGQIQGSFVPACVYYVKEARTGHRPVVSFSPSPLLAFLQSKLNHFLTCTFVPAHVASWVGDTSSWHRHADVTEVCTQLCYAWLVDTIQDFAHDMVRQTYMLALTYVYEKMFADLF